MARRPVIILGNTPMARVLALMLHNAGGDVELVDPTFDEPSPFMNPALGLMGGNDNLVSLMLEALQAWSVASDVVSDEGIDILPWMDVAQNAAMYRKLKDESLLDVLAGYEMTFEEHNPAELGESVLGYKLWKEAPVLPVYGFMEALKERIRAAYIPVHKGAVVSMDMTLPEAPVAVLEDGTRLAGHPLVMACSRMTAPLMKASGLPLPLRPACGHVLRWKLGEEARKALSETFPYILNRLAQGHLWVFEEAPGMLVAHYDAVCDPTQARYKATVNAELEAALAAHVEALVPALAGAERLPTQAVTHWVTPDFLPAFGFWPGVPGLFFAVGFGALEGMFAALVGQVLQSGLQDEDRTGNVLMDAFAPNRFVTGAWEKVHKPGSLDAELASVAPVRMEDAPERTYAHNVQQTEEPKVQHATTVHQVEKSITRAGHPKDQMDWGSSRKPKIRTAAVKA